MMRVLFLFLFLFLEIEAFADVQVATVTVREQSTVVREILARVIAPGRQIIAAETSGVVVSRRLEMGTMVMKGQIIIELDSSEQEAILDIARRELENAGVELAHQIRSLGRATANRSKRVLSEAQFDEFETAHARAQVNQALKGSQVQLQETRLAKYQVKAPFDGELLRATALPGQYVVPGDQLFEVVNVQDLRIALQLTSTELARFLNGDYSLLCHDQALTTIAISPAGDLSTGMTALEMQGCEQVLRAGDSIGVELVRVKYANIPKRGIQTDDQGEYVYVVADGIIARRELTNLQTGERVVVLSADQIEPGDVVSSIRLDEES